MECYIDIVIVFSTFLTYLVHLFYAFSTLLFKVFSTFFFNVSTFVVHFFNIYIIVDFF